MCSTGTGSVSPSQIQDGTPASTRSARCSTREGSIRIDRRPSRKRFAEPVQHALHRTLSRRRPASRTAWQLLELTVGPLAKLQIAAKYRGERRGEGPIAGAEREAIELEQVMHGERVGAGWAS
jgi:hypothetical protein